MKQQKLRRFVRDLLKEKGSMNTHEIMSQIKPRQRPSTNVLASILSCEPTVQIVGEDVLGNDFSLNSTYRVKIWAYRHGLDEERYHRHTFGRFKIFECQRCYHSMIKLQVRSRTYPCPMCKSNSYVRGYFEA